LEQNKLISSSKLELIHPTDRFSGWSRCDDIGGVARNPVTGELYPNKSAINTRQSLEMMENVPAAISHPEDKDIHSYNILEQLLKLPEGVAIPSQKVDTNPSISLGSRQKEPMISSSMQKKATTIYPKIPAMTKEQKRQAKIIRDEKFDEQEAESLQREMYGDAIEVVQNQDSGFNQAEVVQEQTVILKSIQE
jgi:hypothetical protein